MSAAAHSHAHLPLTLAQHLHSQPRGSHPQALSLILDVLALLGQGHASGQIHGTLGPEQIFLSPQGMDLLEITAWGSDKSSPERIAQDVQSVAALLQTLLTGHGAAPIAPSLRALVEQAVGGQFPSAQALGQALINWEASTCTHIMPGHAQALEKMLARMREQAGFASLSDAVVRIQQVTELKNDSLMDLTREILKDTTLTHKLLRLVNSAQYTNSERAAIETVSSAVMLLGFSAVRNMAMSLVLMEYLRGGKQADLMRQGLLRAMMAGAIASEISRSAAEAQEAFIGAMFQNLGSLLCDFYFPEEALRIRTQLESEDFAGDEAQAAQEVLGLWLDDMGLGVAQLWNLPETLQQCMRNPLGAAHRCPPPRPGIGRLRWAARAANEAAHCLLLPAREAEKALRQWAAQHARVLDLSTDAIAEASMRGRKKLIIMAEAIELQVDRSTPAARLLRQPPPLNADLSATPDTTEAPTHYRPRQSAPKSTPAKTDSQAGQPQPQPQPDNRVTTLLAAGVQDVTHAMAGRYLLPEVLRAILQTIYEALGAQHVVFCLRDTRSDQITARFGLGDGVDAVVQKLQIPLRDPNDLFSLICQRNSDTLMADTTQANIQSRLPLWYRQHINAPTFLLLPLQLNSQPLGVIYADQAKAGGLPVDTQAMGPLRMLRNLAVRAFEQEPK